jgi:hypothetical protein
MSTKYDVIIIGSSAGSECHLAHQRQGAGRDRMEEWLKSL